MTEARQARLGVTVPSRTALKATKTAQYLGGVIRAIQLDSGADIARLWALERTVKVDRGA